MPVLAKLLSRWFPKGARGVGIKFERERLELVMSLLNDRSQPNINALTTAVRNIHITNLNLKFFGYELGRALADALPVREDTAPRVVGLPCKASTQADMESDWAAHWCAQLKTPVLFHRKLWEFAYVLQAIYESGHLREGARGLGFGCGQEPLPSYLAAHGVAVTVTDIPPNQALAAGWLASGQHSSASDTAFRSELVDRARYDRLVAGRFVDMNAIPADLAGYDFCWSVCAMEHLGSIDRGMEFVERSLATLRPGGLSVHTTEFNVAPDGPTIDNWPTVLFQRHHFGALADRLRTQGHEVAALDFDLGDKPMDRFVDLPPWDYDMPAETRAWLGPQACLKLAIDGFAATCFGLIVRKAL